MTLTPGTRLGPYEISGPIGAGGMGDVYLARDTRLDRTVAIKVLRGDAPASEDSRRRLVREARAASALNHPNIVAIYDIGSEAGIDFIAMEHVAGVPLHVPSGGLPLERALDCALQITRAVAAAHVAGLVHRDIKPGNVLVTTSGDVKVVDFGLAKVIAAADPDAATLTVPATLTAVGAFCGTPGYAAPEQVEGRAADARSDVFAIGAVLYELLTGRRAFDGGSPASRIAAVLEHEPSPLVHLRRDVPRDLAHIVSRCLEKQPERRYSSAVPLLADLSACHARLTTQRAGLRGLLRRPVVRAAAALLVLAAVSGVAWAWVRQSRTTWARTQALPEAARLIGQRAHFPAFRLLRQAERYIPGDPLLQQLVRESTDLVTVKTTPPGAEVYVRDFLDPPDTWEHLGRSPIERIRLPAWAQVWRVSAPGFQTVDRIGYTSLSPLEFTLRPEKDVPVGMVDVPQQVGAGGANYFWIDKFEVTNRDFKRFVDTGGYARREYWTAALAETGSLTFEAAQRAFRDTTGRPGPAAWELGSYAERTDDHPSAA